MAYPPQRAVKEAIAGKDAPSLSSSIFLPLTGPVLPVAVYALLIFIPPDIINPVGRLAEVIFV